MVAKGWGAAEEREGAHLDHFGGCGDEKLMRSCELKRKFLTRSPSKITRILSFCPKLYFFQMTSKEDEPVKPKAAKVVKAKKVAGKRKR